MIKFIGNIPIFRRLFIAFAVATLIPAIIIALLGSYYLNSLSIRDQAVKTSTDAQSAASQQQINLQRMNALLQTRHNQIFATLSGKVKDASLGASGALINDDILARELDFQQALGNYQSSFELATSSNMSNINNILQTDAPNSGLSTQQQAALNAVINTQWPTYKKLQDQEIKQLDTLQHNFQNLGALTAPQLAQAYAQAYQTLFNANSVFTNLKNSWQSVVDTATTISKTITSVGASQTQSVLLSTIIAVLSSIFVVIVIGYLVSLTITRPLRQLASLTRRIAKGQTDARARLIGRDEISMVADSMNKMLDNIVRLIQETQAQRDNLQAQVEKLVSEVSGVGEGDLRIQAEVTADALGVLADSFNYMTEELGSLIVRVKSVANEVGNSTSSILDRMTQLVEAGDSQINQIASAAIEVEQMANSSRQVADRAQMLARVARDARQNAQGGRDAVQQAVEGMGRIDQNVQETATKVQTLGESSREINNIVEVISNIAHQTNRLALDAAIQAAMAGENGKGFGAVADDIRRLAERSKLEASSIARIVRGIREDIGAAAVSMQDTERETQAGTQLTQEAGVALEAIFTVVEEQALEVENINQVAMQQLQMSSSIVQIMHVVSDTSSKSNSSTRDASQNMERLARLVEQLRASVEAFKLRENEPFLNASDINITEEDMREDGFSMSGLFRTVTAAPSNTGISGASGLQRALPPARVATSYSTPLPSTSENDPFSFYPQTPNQQNAPWGTPQPSQNNGRNYPTQDDQQWASDAFNERAGNGNRSW
ncbi:MAG: methyl-accepting chemotaxis protein [Chloroflexota bacterium]|nr:methyl-accepting chemotaxis protein [Chloroflexota bacterium]